MINECSKCTTDPEEEAYVIRCAHFAGAHVALWAFPPDEWSVDGPTQDSHSEHCRCLLDREGFHRDAYFNDRAAAEAEFARREEELLAFAL